MRLFYTALMLLFAIFPSTLKVAVLRFKGHSIGKGVKIGISYLDIKNLHLGTNAKIGNWNVFKNVQTLEMGDEASVGRFNIFTCNKYYLKYYPDFAGKFHMDDRAVVTMRHYFDLQHSITLGSNSLVAGMQTIFFTHQKGFQKLNEAKPIQIGPRVYIGAACKILPGACIRGHIVVGAGSIVSGELDVEYSLYASPKAELVKSLNENIPYFNDQNPTALD